MRTKRIIISLVLAIAMLTSLFAFSACSNDEETMTVMNVSLNPQVEFVLDGENNVVSVNALNEDGNVVISATAFSDVIGLSAADAVKLFVDVSADTGFLIEGNVKAGENEISISISGDDKTAEKIYNNVKEEVQKYLSTENITASLKELQTVTKEQLQKLLEECAPYLEKAEIAAMDQIELIKKIYASRKQTAELYSQELKKAFYEMQEFAFDQAELEILKSKLSAIGKTAVEAVNATYNTCIATLTETRLKLLVNADSAYQKALAAYRTAKTQYLNFRNYVASLEEDQITAFLNEKLESFQSVLDAAESALATASEAANQAIETAKDALTKAHDTVVSMIETFSVKASDFVTEISLATTVAVNSLGETFEKAYDELIANANTAIEEMRTALEKGYDATQN